MEAAGNKAGSERNIPEYIRDAGGLGVTVTAVADKCVPPSHPYQRDLRQAAEILGRLDTFAHNLWFTVEVIERMRLLTFGQQVDIVDMADQLKKRAADCAEGSRDKQLFVHAGELMDLWYSLSGNYETLREASAQLRFCEAKEGKPSA